MVGDDDFDQADMRRFMTDTFQPFLDRFDRHLENDEKRFGEVTLALTRLSTSIEVQTAIHQAGLRLTQRRNDSWQVKAQTLAMYVAPALALGIAIWK